MSNFRVITTLAFLLLLQILNVTCGLPEWHMKPFGSHIKADTVDETFADDLISPKDFAEKYIIPRKPLVFRGAAKKWPAFSLWTDEYLTENYGDMELRIEGKKEKMSGVPKGDICLGRDRMSTFIKEYKKGADKYVVSDLPTPMYKDVNILSSMSCGDFLDNFVEIDLWMNSDLGKKGQGGNSILHKDAFNTVNCVVNGTKDWKLIELQYNDFMYQSWEGPMDAGYGGFSLINPEKNIRHEFIKATIFRVTFFVFLFWSFLLLLVTMCGWVSYHGESFEKDEIQVNLWSMCTLGEYPGAYDCVDGWLESYLDKNAPVWFNVFRSFFVMSFLLEMLSVFYPIVMFAFTDNGTNRYMWIPGVCQFIAGSFLLIVQILYHVYNQFDFLTQLRYDGLGWSEETPYLEMAADGYYCTWASFGFCGLNVILSTLIWKYELKFCKLDFQKF